MEGFSSSVVVDGLEEGLASWGAGVVVWEGDCWVLWIWLQYLWGRRLAAKGDG